MVMQTETNLWTLLGLLLLFLSLVTALGHLILKTTQLISLFSLLKLFIQSLVKLLLIIHFIFVLICRSVKCEVST